MPQFKYIAQNLAGEKKTGIVDAVNEEDAAQIVRDRHAILLKLKPVKERKDFFSMEIGGNRLNVKAFTVVCSQFAIILNAGIPIARAVKLVGDKTTDKPLKKLLEAVAKDVEGGRSLSASFADRGAKMLPATFIETLAAGESTGNISGSFAAMKEHFEKQSKTRGKVKSAMAYPAFVMVIAVVVVIVLMAVVIPKFMGMFEGMDVELPLPTRMLIGIANFFQNRWYVVAGALVALVVGLRLYGNTEQGKINLAKLALKLPVLGNIQELNTSSQFSSTMAATLSAGLPMNRAVAISARVLDNYYMRTEAGKLTEELETGHTLADAMQDQGIYQEMLVDMCSVGERSGEMEQTLRTVADYYGNELDEAVKGALAKLEPAMLIMIAGIAGFIVIAIYMAVFAMYGGM